MITSQASSVSDRILKVLQIRDQKLLEFLMYLKDQGNDYIAGFLSI